MQKNAQKFPKIPENTRRVFLGVDVGNRAGREMLDPEFSGIEYAEYGKKQCRAGIFRVREFPDTSLLTTR